MTMNAAGLRTTPEALAPQIYLPGREGSLQVEMLAATRRHGLLAYTLRPQLADLLAEIAAGHPVLVLQNLAFNWWPRWHYAVAIGYDLDAGTLTLRSGPEPAQRIPLGTFEHTWQRGGHWALLTLPPERIPATATPDTFLPAALALEQSRQPRAARTAYRAATLRWPRSVAAFIGLGNAAYALGDFAAAATALRNAIALDPDSAIAHNNLADTLLQQNDLDTALAHARRAVQLGGDRQPAFAQTLRDIEARIAASQPSPEP
jgi:tetratricopeptide (TPR) repeat protein